MADTNKTANALLKFFKVEDADGNGHYAGYETSEMDRTLYAFLDGYDGTVGNGFTYNDVRRFLNEVSLDGMSSFYPYFKFRYDEKCDDIWVSFNKAELYPLNSGNISPDDEVVQTVLKESGLPPYLFSHDPAEAFTYETRITHASFVKRSPTLLILEDLHENASSQWFNVQIIQRLLESNESLVVFFEDMNGSIVYDMKEAEKFWQLLKGYMTNYDDADTQEAIKFKNTLYPGAKWDMKLLMAKGSLNALFGDEIGSIDLARLREKLVDNAVLRGLFSCLDFQLTLKVIFGDRILMVNSESYLPTDARTINEGGPSKVKGWDELDKTAIISAALDVFPKVGEERNSCEAPAPLSPYEISVAITGVRTFADSVNARTDNWAANLAALAYDPRNSYELPLPLTHDPPTLVLIGGATHIPRLVQKLKGQFSIISAISDRSDEKIRKMLQRKE